MSLLTAKPKSYSRLEKFVSYEMRGRIRLNKQTEANKTAWEYRAYEFWTKRDGTPAEKAKELLKDPRASLKKHRGYFHDVEGLNVANICGSNGRKAVPLSLMGANVTIFDVSEENRRYALELAACAQTSIDFVLGDVYGLDVNKYEGQFDILYLEGGILHYFDDLNRLCNILYSILKPGGTMILNDYHPLKRCIGPESTYMPVYFDNELHEENIVFKSFFDEDEQQDFPDVLLTHHTLSDIMTSVITAGFQIRRFDEHRGWDDENIPWEFTMVAAKI